MAAQRLVRRVPVGESVVEAILTLVRAGRAETTDVDEVRRHVAWGPGPRASQALMLACRARALLGGRFAPSIDDVVALAHPILRHRMALEFHRPRRRRDLERGHRSALCAARNSAGDPRGMAKDAPALRQRAEALASTLPPLLVAAERIALTVSQGVHGRRRVGQGETFWQFRRYHIGDCRPAHRLAAIGQARAAVRAGDRMGGGAERLAVARRLRLHALALPRDLAGEAGARRSADAGARRPADPRRRAHRAPGFRPAALDGPHRAEPHGRATAAPRRAGRQHAQDGAPAPPCPRDLHRRLPVAAGDGGEAGARPGAEGVTGHILQVLDPAEEALPFAGRVEFEGLEGEGKVLLSRVESLRGDYVARMVKHMQGIADIARSVGWSCVRHRTDQPPQAVLLALYLRLADRFSRTDLGAA